MSWYFWVIIGVVLLIMEIFTAGFFVALIGVAALLTAISSLFVKVLWLQLLIFTILSILVVWIFLPLVKKSLTKEGTDTNQDAMIGKRVKVTEEIDNEKDKGYVKYYADYFPARSVRGTVIPAGREVVIRRIEGIRVFVEEVEN